MGNMIKSKGPSVSVCGLGQKMGRLSGSEPVWCISIDWVFEMVIRNAMPDDQLF